MFPTSRRGLLVAALGAPLVLQRSIDQVAAGGGGTVVVPPGRHETGTVILRGGVHLRLEPGAVLAGSRSLTDYPLLPGPFRGYADNYTERSLIYAADADDAGIEGPGVIDGQGQAFPGPYKVRPYLMRFVNCRRVTVRDVTLRDAAMWVQHYLNCEDVLLDGVRVRSHVNANNDGIDIDCSRRVRIANCDISSGDDALVLKSTAYTPCRDVVVSNCVLQSRCNAFKLGTESNGGFENITFTGSTIYDTRLAGVALESVDGGTLERVVVSGITMNGVGAPIFLRLGDRGRPPQADGARPPVGRLRHVLISGVYAAGCGPTGCAIAGLPGAMIEDVTLENLRLEFAGGGSREQAERTPEESPDKYPEFQMFGPLPAYGFFVRHARDVQFRNVRVWTRTPDARPALKAVNAPGLLGQNLE